MLSARDLSRLLDNIQRSPTLWRRLGAGSRQADMYAALVAAEVEDADEGRRAGLLEARMAPPIGPAERLLSYAQWCEARATQVNGEGSVGGGRGEGYWPGKQSAPDEPAEGSAT